MKYDKDLAHCWLEDEQAHGRRYVESDPCQQPAEDGDYSRKTIRA